jgi:hypothetical protein
MRVLRASFLARRMGSAWLLLSCLMASVLITSALIAALVNFYAHVLPDSVRQELVASGAVSLGVSGSTQDSTAAAQTAATTAWLRTTLRPVSYQLYGSVWSDDLNLPGPQVAGNVAVLQAAAMDDVKAFSVLTAGTWPGNPRPGQPIPAVLPVGAAAQLKVGVGTVLKLSDRTTGAAVRLRVTGLFRRKVPASLYWNSDLIGPSGLTVSDGFASYGPAVVSPAAFGATGAAGSENPGGVVAGSSPASGTALARGDLSFVALPDLADIGPADLTTVANRIDSAEAVLPNSPVLGGMTASTALPGLLLSAARQLEAARALVIISALQLLLLAAAALALAGRLLASHRDEESALLAARGAARWQLIRPSVAEAILACAAAAAVGAAAGGRLASLLQSGVGRGVVLPAGSAPAAWVAVAIVFLLCLVIVIWPALRPAGIADVRVRRGRQALVAGAVAAGADIGLIVLALLSVRELRSYSAATGGTGIDPVVVIAPALALAGLAVVALRLVPLAARALERLTARGRRLGTAMANWEISRRPIRQSGPILLVILAVGAGTLALAQYQSWRQSVTDQANFAVGADVRVDLAQPLTPAGVGRISQLPGVTAAMPVSQIGYSGGTGQVLAVGTRQAAATVLMRSDLSKVPAAQLWREIAPGTQAGLVIPGRPAVLAIMASIKPGAAGRAIGPVSAQVTVQDASGATYQLPAGSIPADGRPHEFQVQIAPSADARYPLRLLGLSLTYNWLPGNSQVASPATVSITGLAESPTATGPVGHPFAAGAALSGFQVELAATDLAYLNRIDGDAGGTAPQEVRWTSAGHAQTLVFDPGQAPVISPLLVRKFALQNLTAQVTILARYPLHIVPAVATASFLTANHLHVGSLTSLSIGSTVIPLHIVAVLSAFPTITGPGALIIDQVGIQDLLASQNGLPLPVTSWWLSTAGGATPAGLPAGSSVTTAAGVALALRSEPLAAAPVRGAVAMSAAAALLAAFGFCVNVAASARSRRSQRALLAALGVPPSAQARLFCLEELMLSAPAAAVGLGIGVLLAHLLIPAMTVSANAGRPVPSVLVSFPAGWVIALAVAVPVIPIVAAAISAVRQPDPAAELRAAEAA